MRREGFAINHKKLRHLHRKSGFRFAAGAGAIPTQMQEVLAREGPKIVLRIGPAHNADKLGVFLRLKVLATLSALNVKVVQPLELHSKTVVAFTPARAQKKSLGELPKLFNLKVVNTTIG